MDAPQAEKHSYANTAHVRTTQLSLHVDLDFKRHVLHGFVELSMLILKPTKTIVLDTKQMTIAKVTLGPENLKHTVGDNSPVFGSSLIIELSAERAKDDKFRIRVYYRTTPESSALQWLAPNQTSGKKHPYVFTQCQAIHARSFIPCQDTPSVKAAYDASITVPDAALVVVMGAVAHSNVVAKDGTRNFKFMQKVPIPSYLIAMAAGALEFQPIGKGDRCGVWSEHATAAAAAAEFAETPRFLAEGERILIPYQWGRYDILVLPPSFPYGGMENPCLTFATPTLLAGDGSLANVIAHEAAHSWSGNLVTNGSWEHFWLNEGFTVFLERKLVAAVYGQPVADLQALIGWKELCDEVERFTADGNLGYTAMVPKLDGVDPDDAFSSVPYEKGFNFLVYLERLFGGPSVFEPFLAAYFDKFKEQSISTEDMKSFLETYFTETVPKVAQLKEIDWKVWLNAPGLPPVTNKFDDSLAVASRKLTETWKAGGAATKDDLHGWSTPQKMYFLDQLIESGTKFTVESLNKMDELYSWSSSKVSELQFRWYSLNLQCSNEAIFPKVVEMVTCQGRMKFTRPLYRAMHKCSAAGSALAKETFKKHSSFYHPICHKMVASDLAK